MDVAFELTPLVAGKLFVYTFGTLVHLFLMVLILGQRRLGRLEWLLFMLMAAVFMWNSGNLLALNIDLFYGEGPPILTGAARVIALAGLVLSAPFLVHVHIEYLGRLRPVTFRTKFLPTIFYLPLILSPWLLNKLLVHIQLDPVIALRPFTLGVALWVIAAQGVAAGLNIAFCRSGWVQDARLGRFHGLLAAIQAFLGLGLAWAYLLNPPPSPGLGGYFPTFLMLVAALPGVLVGYSIFRYNFLDLRVQRNLAYAVITIFAALIYLTLMRRLGGFLEAYAFIPSVVTEGVMIFLLVAILEPVKKVINRALHAAFVSEFEVVQKLATEIQEYAEQSGDIEGLKRFVGSRVPEALGVEKLELGLGSVDAERPSLPGAITKVRRFPIHRAGQRSAYLEVTSRTGDLSGDQFGALQLLADQLAAVELCQLIAAKLQLERELAEKAKMAFLGEMAARIAHNVKNPLSSMKTLVQLFEQDATLPDRVRRDCRLVTEEIDRLNNNISQVLRYAKPARDTDRPVDLAAVVTRVLTLARADAERQQVKLEFATSSGPMPVEGGEEAASDIVSNLVVNALEASRLGGMVRIRLDRVGSTPEHVELSVEDQGGGISPELKEKIFQPFFTTRPGGTGLGLSIVARRAEEIGGTVECMSPIDSRGGARFVVRFRSASAAQSAVKETYALHPHRG